MLFVIALTVIVVFVVSAAIAFPLWLAKVGLSSLGDFIRGHQFRFTRNFVYAATAFIAVIGVQLALPHPIGGPVPFWVALAALYYFAFYGRPNSQPDYRPGERILQRQAMGSSHQLGGSQLMQTADLMRLGLVRPNGDGFPHIGLIGDIPIVYPGDGHLLTIAPAGSGKSSGPVAVNLLTYPGSMVATDPKGELAKLTAHWRADQGSAVHVIDPWAIVPIENIPGGNRASFNPLDLIPGGWAGGQPFEGPDSIDNAHLLAEALIVEGSKTDPHWDRAAKALLTGLLLIAALDPEWKAPRTLVGVNDLLGVPADVMRQFLEGAGRSPIKAATAEVNQFLAKGDKEAAGILSTINVNMRFLQGSALQQAFSGSSIDWASVKATQSTVYLCIPPSRLTTHSQFLRLMFSTALAKMETPPPARYSSGQPFRPVLFLMDEFANLGRLAKISEAYALMRGYGIKLWAFVQDMTQLKDLYQDRWETFVGNADVIQCFGTRDNFTSEYISKLSGDFTQRIVSTSFTSSENKNAPTIFNPHNQGTTGTSQGQTTSESFNATPLLYPSDVRELFDNEQILLIKGRATIQWRVRWFQHLPYSPHLDYLEKRSAKIKEGHIALLDSPTPANS